MINIPLTTYFFFGFLVLISIYISSKRSWKKSFFIFVMAILINLIFLLFFWFAYKDITFKLFNFIFSDSDFEAKNSSNTSIKRYTILFFTVVTIPVSYLIATIISNLLFSESIEKKQIIESKNKIKFSQNKNIYTSKQKWINFSVGIATNMFLILWICSFFSLLFTSYNNFGIIDDASFFVSHVLNFSLTSNKKNINNIYEINNLSKNDKIIILNNSEEIKNIYIIEGIN